MDAARSRYLDDASKYLFENASTTSAYLSAERIALKRDGPRTSDMAWCRSCGTTFVPGSTMELKIQRLNARLQASKKEKAGPDRNATTTSALCKVCGRSSRESGSTTIKKPAARRAKADVVKPDQPRTSEAVVEAPTRELPTKQAAESKPSSKQRAKARKDREGLQALLNRSKAGAGTTKLSFMDLMKK